MSAADAIAAHGDARTTWVVLINAPHMFSEYHMFFRILELHDIDVEPLYYPRDPNRMDEAFGQQLRMMGIDYKNCTLFGHGVGGLCALHIATRYPWKAVVTLDAMVPPVSSLSRLFSTIESVSPTHFIRDTAQRCRALCTFPVSWSNVVQTQISKTFYYYLTNAHPTQWSEHLRWAFNRYISPEYDTYKHVMSLPNVYCFLSQSNHLQPHHAQTLADYDVWKRHTQPIVVSEDFLRDYFQCEVVFRVFSNILCKSDHDSLSESEEDHTPNYDVDYYCQ